MTLNRELMTRWIEALRSGRYLQGRDYLCSTDGAGDLRYCCLGVLQDIEPGITVQENDFAVGTDDAGTQVLDEETLGRYLGVNLYSHPTVFYQSNYAKLNDQDEYTFAEIADVLVRDWLLQAPK